MVTGASTADAAVILIDARKGVLTQTRRHSYLVALLGIRHVALAVNKMDLVGYDWRALRGDRGRVPRVRRRDRPRRRHADPGLRAARRQRRRPQRADALVRRPDADRVPRDRSRSTRTGCSSAPFRLPVQWVDPPGPRLPRLRRHDRRRRRAAGRRGAASCPRAARATVARIVTYDGDLEQAVAGQSVTLDARPTRSTSAAAT